VAEHAPSGAHVPDAGRVEPVRVAVVDDQAPFRAAARAVIGRTPGFEQVGEAGDGAQALALLADTAVDLVLMDIKMPVLDGIAATGRIAVDHPDVVVFLLSSHDRSSLPDDLAACGAAAFVPKEELSPRLLAELWAARVTRRGAGGPD
jgi:two-component system invasion response regulator UvrY